VQAYNFCNEGTLMPAMHSGMAQNLKQTGMTYQFRIHLAITPERGPLGIWLHLRFGEEA